MKWLKIGLVLLAIGLVAWVNWMIFNQQDKGEFRTYKPRIERQKDKVGKPNLGSSVKDGVKKVKTFREGDGTRPFLETQLKEAGLVSVQKLDSSIQVQLAYATTDNFMNRNVYYHCKRAYLQPEVAEMLVEANTYLKSLRPNLRIHVFDAVRPLSVQEYMWKEVKGTEKQMYVASPASGSMHNYGAAVDVGLADKDGNLLDMGTSFDFFGPEAQPRFEEKFLAEGKLTKKQVDNRALLRLVMKHASFRGIQSEWWHFNAFSKEETRAKYSIIE